MEKRTPRKRGVSAAPGRSPGRTGLTRDLNGSSEGQAPGKEGKEGSKKKPQKETSLSREEDHLQSDLERPYKIDSQRKGFREGSREGKPSRKFGVVGTG